MKIHRAYKVEIAPTEEQLDLLLRHAGCARWVYNWALRHKIDEYNERKENPDAPKKKALGKYDLQKMLTVIKNTPEDEGGFPWLQEVASTATNKACEQLDTAFQNFFRRCKKGEAKKGFPRFKSKAKGIGSFQLAGSIRVFEDAIKLPRIGMVKLKEKGYLPYGDREDIKILGVTVSERADKWFVSLRVEQEVADPVTKDGAVGVDVGIKTLATVSNGVVFENVKALYKAQAKLRRLQKDVSRKKKGSANRKKAIKKLAKQHYRVTCIRQDMIHKATSQIAQMAGHIGIETLNVKGMMQNKKLARALSDASMSEFLRILEYKVEWNGGHIYKVDRFFPSSKTCSGCGHVKEELSLSERTYHCEECGMSLDRDLNAAINLMRFAQQEASKNGATFYVGEDTDQTTLLQPEVQFEEPGATA